MTTTEQSPSSTARRSHDPSEGPVDKERSSPRKPFPTAVIVVVIAGAASYAAWKYPEEVWLAWATLTGKGNVHRVTAATTASGPKPPRHWDGSITVKSNSQTAMGLDTARAEPQEEPIRLELLGTTEYISDSLTKVRPMFKGRVDKVHVKVSQAVKKGDSLIDLYSKDLAEAKGDYEIERIQWVHDKTLLDLRERLVKTNAISQFVYEETKNMEMKSRKEYAVTRDKLFLYGLSEDEIEKIDQEPGSQKARMTLRSATDGFVIERDVVQGNLYDENDTLLVIAPLDRLWVWGNVFESDLDLVRLGQSWEIRFPFLDQKLHGRVEYISNRVDPNSHAVRIRTSIPNPDGKLKSDMLVRGMLEIPPAAGRTVVPRTALIVDDGHYYVFVQDETDPEKFRRRDVGVAQEKDDHVVIDDGLKAGEAVVSVGGLILAQIYEDLKTARTGAPVASHEPGGD